MCYFPSPPPQRRRRTPIFYYQYNIQISVDAWVQGHYQDYAKQRHLPLDTRPPPEQAALWVMYGLQQEAKENYLFILIIHLSVNCKYRVQRYWTCLEPTK